MPITKSFKKLTDQEKASVEKRLPRDEEGKPTTTVEKFLESIDASNETLAEYARQDAAEDKAKWGKVVDIAFKLSPESRMQLVVLVKQLAQSENIDVSDIGVEL